jgi:mxaA protein
MRLAVLLCLAVWRCAAAQDADPSQLQASTEEPRSFGYQVGDVLQRHVRLRVPAGLQLDETSLPRAGARGQALELQRLERKVQRRVFAGHGNTQEQLTLHYQVFNAPTTVRTFELPAFSLRFVGQPRAQELRIDAWPVTVAPLVPLQVSPRAGLGAMQPDQAPPLINTRPAQWRMKALGGLLSLLLAYLAVVYFGLPWRQARRRPFALAWQQLRHLPNQPSESTWRQACKQLHQALNHSAGEVVFAQGLQAFTNKQPAFAHEATALQRFLQLSQQSFFAPDGPAERDGAWLRELCRRCRNAERGS